MAGSKMKQDLLNTTLKLVLYLLTKHNFQNWFIAYGTLLGIHRDGQCIDGDDDVDIVIDDRDLPRLREVLKQEGLQFCNKEFIKKSNYFVRIEGEHHCPVDFYGAKVDNDGNYLDCWEVVAWSKCTPLIKRVWNGLQLQLPQNVEKKLEGRYGKDWKKKIQTKGLINPKNRVL